MQDRIDLGTLDAAWASLPPAFAAAQPTCGMVLGSGWSLALPREEVIARVGYAEITGLGASTVAGHAGELLLLRRRNTMAAIFCGRRHWYEGEGWTPVILPIEILRRMGVRDLLLTNAAGGINPRLHPGDFLLLADQINTVGLNPLQGPMVPGWGPRFPDQSQLYHPEIRKSLLIATRKVDIPMTEGVYAFTSGPAYETPAEIRGYATLGADAVGMSTVPEAIVAHAAGLRVAAISCITNRAAGISGPLLSHQEVLSVSRNVSPQMTRLLDLYLEVLAKPLPKRAADTLRSLTVQDFVSFIALSPTGY